MFILSRTLGGTLGETIKGLYLIENAINEAEEKALLTLINNLEWSAVLSRRVQQYGYDYVYHTSSKLRSSSITELPDWAIDIANKLIEIIKSKYPELVVEPVQQLIINEYQPGQGISNHIDDTKQFGPYVLTLSLGDGIEMDFTKNKESSNSLQESSIKECIPIYIPRRSVYLLTEDARYTYMHGIKKRKNDIINGMKRPRSTRISLTFRSINI